MREWRTRRVWAGWLPGLALVRERRGASLRRDLLAGVVLAALLVPQGMGYAQLAGLPPVTGLYATLVPLVVYFLLGPIADPDPQPRLGGLPAGRRGDHPAGRRATRRPAGRARRAARADRSGRSCSRAGWPASGS